MSNASPSLSRDTSLSARPINQAGLDLIKRFEGLRLQAYDDNGAMPGGVWTIGYGHTGGVRPGDEITEAEAERLLREDLATAERAVIRLVHVPLSGNQFATLVSFAFNVGEGALARSTLLKRLNQGRYEDVPAQLMRWVFQGKTRLRGLERRRAAEADLWLAEEVPAPSSVEAEEGQGKNPALSLTMWGGIAALAAPVVEAVAEQISGYANLPQPVFWALTGLAILGAAAAIYGRYRVMREEGK